MDGGGLKVAVLRGEMEWNDTHCGRALLRFSGERSEHEVLQYADYEMNI
jgi:hypothetical protein